MSKRLKHTVTERAGVNFVKNLFEGQNCIFKEINKEHDYGHDAYVVLVDEETVLPKEIALQIKSGKSFVTNDFCKIPCTESQREYWRQHPLVTFGIVYDPMETCAYRINLKNACINLVQCKGHQTINFQKGEFNRINEYYFKNVWLQILLGRLPTIPIEIARRWAFSHDRVLSYFGLRILSETFGNIDSVWEDFFLLFESREPEYVDPYLIYLLAHIPGHGDILWQGSLREFLVGASRERGARRLKNYTEQEIIKLLTLVDENGFERGSVGQSCAAIINSIEGAQKQLKNIVCNKELSETIRQNATILLSELYY